MHGCCYVWPWLSEFSDVVLSCFTPSRSAIFTDVSLIKPKDSFNPLFKAVLYSVSWVKETWEFPNLLFTSLQIAFFFSVPVSFRNVIVVALPTEDCGGGEGGARGV